MHSSGIISFCFLSACNISISLNYTLEETVVTFMLLHLTVLATLQMQILD